MTWLHDLTYIRTSYCKNLHAKCYLNEESGIITSLNLYEFSQVNNNEMGVQIRRSEDSELYREAYEEAQRIIRISEEVRISLERISQEAEGKPEDEEQTSKLTSSKLAQKLGLKTGDLLEKLVVAGYLELKDGKHYLKRRAASSAARNTVRTSSGPKHARCSGRGAQPLVQRTATRRFCRLVATTWPQR